MASIQVPDGVIERAKAAYQRRRAGPVAAMVSDAADERGRRLLFSDGTVRVEVVVTAAGSRWDLRGRVEPAQFRVELELEDSPLTVAADATGGSFAFEGVPAGLMRLRLLAGQGAEPNATGWFRV